MLELSSLLDEIRRLIEPLVGSYVRLIIQLDPAIRVTPVNRLPLEQILVHLAANAPQAMPRGGRVIISTDSLPPGSPIDPHVVLNILYSGCELDLATQDRILFEPFSTTGTGRTGAVLRQATISGILKHVGGRISVQRAPHLGTTFRIYLPRTDHRVAFPNPVESPGKPSARRKTVLLVDDEPMVRGVAREMLQALGYVVLEAAHAQEALRLCQESRHRIHLLLSDVVMPGINGPELAGRVTSVSRDIKVLFMSGYTCGVIRGAGEPESSRAFLHKPFSLKDLGLKVNDALHPSRNLLTS